jgi:hypothetical protein
MTLTLNSSTIAAGRKGVCAALGLAVIALPVLAAGAAQAESLSGNYPITVVTTHPSPSVEQYCLTLVEDGASAGQFHRGTAALGGVARGQFVMANDALVTTVSAEDVHFTIAASPQPGGSAFLAIDEGRLAAAGTATAGRKGGCTPAA